MSWHAKDVHLTSFIDAWLFTPFLDQKFADKMPLWTSNRLFLHENSTTSLNYCAFLSLSLLLHSPFLFLSSLFVIPSYFRQMDSCNGEGEKEKNSGEEEEGGTNEER